MLLFTPAEVSPVPVLSVLVLHLKQCYKERHALVSFNAIKSLPPETTKLSVGFQGGIMKP